VKKSLGDRLKELRGGDSQTSFCHKIQQKQGTYSAWERDEKDPSSTAIALICSRCGVSADWLLGLSDAASVTVTAVPEPQADAYWRDLVASQQGTISSLTALLAARGPTNAAPARAGGRSAAKSA